MGNYAQCWLICIFLFGSIAQVYSQAINFEDGFEDGNFTSNPTWTWDKTLDDTLYTITSDGTNNLLQLDGNENEDPAYLATPSTSVTGSWEFFFKYNGGRAPSSSNRAVIFLMSDQANLEGDVNGYGVQIGESGDDFFHLVRFDSGSASDPILSDTTTIQSNETGYRVKVTRRAGGKWQMSVAEGYGGVLPNPDTTAVDNTYLSSTHFGIHTDYTSTRSDNFFYDDFSIIEFPIALSKLTAISNKQFEILFTQNLDPASVEVTDFSINNTIGNPDNISIQDSLATLSYTTPLSGNDYILTINNIKDQSGNTIEPNTTISFSLFDLFEPGDLILNEFMYDPPAGLPEYVEIRNTSAKYLNLQHWQIGDESDTAVVSEDTLALAPHSYLVVAPDTAGLSTIFGDRTYVKADLPSFNNTGDALTLISASGALADSLYYQPFWGGNQVALERRAASVPAIYRPNWGLSPASNNGTPGAANQVTPDTEAPKLDALAILSGQRLQLIFNERLDASAADAGHYNLSGVTIGTATFSAPDTVGLALNSSLQNARQYQLDLSDLQDIFGNSITSIDTTFTYYKISPVDSGEVVINEFMYDPPSGTTEYIELYNHSDKTLDLNGWTINDNTGNQNSITYRQYLLPPDSLVILAPDSSLSASDPRLSLITMGSRFPSLNNSGDGISLRDSSGTKLDSLQYSAGWGGQALALERRSPTLGADYASNWGKAPNGFGTPGKPNNIGADEMPPQIEQFSITAPDSLQLILSEYPDEASAETNAHYSISGTPSIASAHFHPPDTVTIALSATLQNNTTYTFALEGLPDLFGNAATTADTTFSYYKVSPVDSGDVFISEFLFDPPEGRSEYIELYNPTQQSFNLKQWTFNDNTGGLRTITDERYILAPDDYVVIAADRSLASQNNDLSLITMGSFPSLNNSGDDIVLRDSSGLLLDSLQYTGSWSTSGQTSERRSYELSATYKANWGPPADSTGSPGLANTVAPDIQPPKLIALSISDDRSLQLIFDEYLSSPSTQGTFSVSGDPQISDKEFNAPDTVQLSLSQPLENAETYTISIADMQDLFGNTMAQSDTSFTFYQPVPVDSGQVVINEFRAEPSPGHTEYIELYNPTAHSFDLGNWTINDNRGNPVPVTNASYILPPQSFVVIAPDNSLLSDHPDIRLLATAQFPALNNSGDDIVLREARGLLLDSLRYTSSWRTDSTAFERRSASVSGSYAENWGSSPAVTGGTPGMPNQVEADQNPPRLQTVIPSDRRIKLTFDERLAPTTAQDLKNYGLTDLQINSIRQEAPYSILLMLNQNLQNAQKYRLTFSGLQDIFGNQMAPQDTTLTYFAVSPADSGDILINEFLFDPTEGSPEYIELYNHTSKSLDLQGWSINDNTGSRSALSDQTYLLPPDTFVLLTTDSTLIQRHPNVPVLTMNSRFPSLNNSGDDIVLRDSSGTLIDSLRYTASWAGSGKAAERRSLDIASFYEANWGSPADVTGSPGLPNAVDPDAHPPALKSFTILGAQELQLIFDERIADVAPYGAFDISDPLQISDQTLAAPDTIFLQLFEPLQDATQYQLTVSEVQDVFGNQSASTDTLFTYYQPSKADSGQVFINEFSYNPAAGQAEYIELYNPTEYSFDLRGWTLNDNRGTPNVIITESYILPPNSYVVLSPDNSLLQTAPGLPLIAMGSHFPALNNSGDDIVVKNRSGLPIDSLRFTSAWGGNEMPLERRTISIPGFFAENWSDAPTPSGTPGTDNQVAGDQQAPKLKNINIASNTEIQLIFSERLLPGSTLNRSNYTISPSRNIQLIAIQADTVSLFLAQPLASDQEYLLTLSGIRDVFGNKRPEGQHKIEFIKLTGAIPGDIVLNEIMSNPGPASVEFIEIYNRSEKNIDLANWTISDASSRAVLPAGVLLKAGQYLVLTGNPTFAQSKPQAVNVPGFPSLNNTSDALTLQTASGTLIDSLRYNKQWNITGRAASLERKDPRAASGDASNWTINNSSVGHSAGTKNSSFQPDDIPPDALFAKIRTDETIAVYFTEFIQQNDSLQFLLDGTLLAQQSFDPKKGNRIILQNTAPTGSSITIRNLRDVRGNLTTSTQIPLAHPLRQGDLVINEIMFNPLDDADDNKANQSEYAELYNTRSYAISLEGLVLHDAPDEDGNFRTLRLATRTAKWVGPGETVLIYPSETTVFTQSKVARFFAVDTTQMRSILRVERDGLSLASSGDAFFIADSSGTTVDSVFYDESWHNPNLLDTKGIALERISPKGASNAPANWGSSVHPKGGTPLAQNSLYQQQPDQPSKVGISFAPNPFSPDGDGYEDNLVISYKLDQADYLLRINIFDRYGRHIKKLADGKPAGFEGSLIWDGRRDDGRRNRIGIYIIVFEAYDSSSGSDKAFKKTVVIARKLN